MTETYGFRTTPRATSPSGADPQTTSRSLFHVHTHCALGVNASARGWGDQIPIALSHQGDPQTASFPAKAWPHLLNTLHQEPAASNVSAMASPGDPLSQSYPALGSLVWWPCPRPSSNTSISITWQSFGGAGTSFTDTARRNAVTFPLWWQHWTVANQEG